MRDSRLPTITLIIFLLLLPSGMLFSQENKQEKPVKPASEDAKMQPLDLGKPAAPVDGKSYIIGAEDQLQVRVWREREVSGAVIVRPDGKITMPLIGDVMASGRTPEQLKQVITEKLSAYLTRPEVMVSVMAVRSKKYYLTGQVNHTGEFPLVVPTTVLEALSRAGGFQQWANRKKIVILRGSKRLKFNYNEVIKGKHLEQNVYLKNGDNIVVP